MLQLKIRKFQLFSVCCFSISQMHVLVANGWYGSPHSSIFIFWDLFYVCNYCVWIVLNFIRCIATFRVLWIVFLRSTRRRLRERGDMKFILCLNWCEKSWKKQKIDNSIYVNPMTAIVMGHLCSRSHLIQIGFVIGFVFCTDVDKSVFSRFTDSSGRSFNMRHTCVFSTYSIFYNRFIYYHTLSSNGCLLQKRRLNVIQLNPFPLSDVCVYL